MNDAGVCPGSSGVYRRLVSLAIRKFIMGFAFIRLLNLGKFKKSHKKCTIMLVENKGEMIL